MKLATAIASPIDIRLTETVPTGAGGVGDRGGLRLLITTNDGYIGLGETAPIPGVDGYGIESLGGEISKWSAASEGKNPEELIDELDSVGMSALARFAVHTALVDLVAGANGIPLAQYLRAGSPATVSVNSLVSAANPGAVHTQVAEQVNEGVTAIKLKVGVGDPTTDVTRIIAASEAAGPYVELRLDANRSWDRETAERVLGRVGYHRVSYIEDPTEDAGEYGAIHESTGVRVALDLPPDVDPLEALEQSSASVLVVKPAAIGGVDRILDLARAHDELTIVVSSSIDREIALAAAIHVAAALPTSTAHGLSTGSIVRSMPTELLASGGLVTVPTSVGVFRPPQSTS